MCSQQSTAMMFNDSSPLLGTSFCVRVKTDAYWSDACFFIGYPELGFGNEKGVASGRLTATCRAEPGFAPDYNNTSENPFRSQSKSCSEKRVQIQQYIDPTLLTYVPAGSYSLRFNAPERKNTPI